MYLTLNKAKTYVATGGKVFDSALPAVVFLHGSGMDHRCWALQSRWFAFHGYSVLAPDFPGHSLSEGKPLESIEGMAQWVWQLINQMGVEQTSVVGHSQGALVAMEMASAQPARVRSLSIIASAAAIPVNEQLISLAASDQNKAVAAMLNWGFGQAYQFGLSAVPGQAPIGIGTCIMQNNPLHTDLVACNAYTRGKHIAAKLTMPAQLILAEQDRMTPARAGQALAKLLPNVQSMVSLKKVGHMLPIEAPDDCLHALKQFISNL